MSPYSVLVAADNTPSDYSQPEIVIPDKPNMQHWLLDSRGVDQFLLHYDSTLELDWNNIDYTKTWNDPAQKTPDVYWRKEDRPAQFCMWSPKGTYLLTAHQQGVFLWGGPPPFEKPVGRFEHQDVSKADFSPCEKFLVTASVTGKSEDPKEEDPKKIVFHEVATGKRKMEFVGVKSNVWPLFRWSYDDQFFATVTKDKIQIYEASTMQLLGGTSIKVRGVKMFAWSPSANILAYYVPPSEDGNHPAGVTLIEVPSKTVLRQKNLFDLRDCRLHWHPSGAYLAVKVDRVSGKNKKGKSARVFFGKELRKQLLEQDPDLEPVQLNRKVDEMWEKATPKVKETYEKMAKEDKERHAKEVTFFTTFQVFRANIKGVPVDELEFEKNDPVVAFAWQPAGDMFAILHGRAAKPDLSIYTVTPTELKLLKKFEQKQANNIFWSPVRDCLVLANVKAPQGNLEFINAGTLESMTTAEHQNATEFLWDPRGRFFVTVISAWRQNVETGYYLWNFNGRLLAKVTKPKFFEFLWRPRPQSLLSAADEANVLKNMSSLVEEFHREDELRRRLERREFYETRNEQRSTYYDNLNSALKEYEALAAKHKDLLAKLKREEPLEKTEEWVEQVIEETTTIM